MWRILCKALNWVSRVSYGLGDSIQMVTTQEYLITGDDVSELASCPHSEHQCRVGTEKEPIFPGRGSI